LSTEVGAVARNAIEVTVTLAEKDPGARFRGIVRAGSRSSCTTSEARSAPLLCARPVASRTRNWMFSDCDRDVLKRPVAVIQLDSLSFPSLTALVDSR
jgi:hypothetical protein